MQSIDVERCRQAMKLLNVDGDASGKSPASHGNQGAWGRPRWKQIEAAIVLIASDGAKALMDIRYCVKNYASFGDQVEDHRYGTGPRHGSIVFSIERTREGKDHGGALGDDHIYLLECVRDSGPYKFWAQHGERTGNLCDAIRARDKAEQEMLSADAWLNDAQVESHTDMAVVAPRGAKASG